MLMLFVDVFR